MAIRKAAVGGASPLLHFVAAAAAAMSLLGTRFANAEPWIAPGDELLRHDLQLLADRGIVRGPLMTWPLSWGDISRDVAKFAAVTTLNAAEQAALARVRERASHEARAQPMQPHLRLALGSDPRTLRTFEYTPREDAEVEAGVQWTGLHMSYRLQVSGVDGADDGDSVRADGSYVGAATGNWMFALGLMDRWWGPGWDGSLILSSNARPIPALSVNRNYSDPFALPVLRLLGPWSASILMGQLEHDAVVPDALFFGARFDFRPTTGLEIGISRTAQWCGEGRPCDAGTFWELLTGNDNNGGNGITPANDPGNQLAGVDWRWSAGSHGWPVALYGQMIGEDEANGLPSRYIGQAGVETWGRLVALRGNFRVHVEYADTAAAFYESPPRFDYAYEHYIYQEGYRYKGRPIGHSLDNDGRLLSVGGLLTQDNGHGWNVLLQVADLNRGGGLDNRNTVSKVPANLYDLEFGHERALGPGRLELTVGYQSIDDKDGGATDDGARVMAQWYWML
jgi:hypothetical protein